MLKFTYKEEDGRDIEMTLNDYPSFELMCSMFADFVAARGYDKADLAYAFADEAFKDMSLDDLCDEWREAAVKRAKAFDAAKVDEIIEATIDALVVSDKYYVRRLK